MNKESIIRKNERDGLEIEELARRVLKSEGYQIIPLIKNYRFVNIKLHKMLRDPKVEESMIKHFGKNHNLPTFFTFVDYLCKKGNFYYLFDIKYKTYKNDRYKNKVYATKNEVYQYNRLTRNTDVKVLIMIVLNVKNSLFYRIFDWNDFRYNQQIELRANDPTTIGITLKEEIKPDMFKRFNNTN